MGCWGTGIFEDDLALDVRDLYDELISKDYNDKQVTAKVFEMFKESIEDDDEGIIVYLALAAIQLSRSSLQQEIKVKTMAFIENNSGMDRWKESSKADYKARLKELDKLNRILSLAKTAPEQADFDNASITDEYNEPLMYSVYELTNHAGNVVYVGTTAFPEKRFKYMNYVEFKRSGKIKGLFGLLGTTKTKEEEFWEWFSQNELNLFKADDMNDTHMKELFKKIKMVHPGLTVEFSHEAEADIDADADNKKTMAISADGISERFPYVIKLMNEPKLLSKWIIVPFRQLMKNIDGLELRIDDIIIQATDIFFRSKVAGNMLDLNIYVKGVDNIDNAIINAVFIILDSAIGEYDVVTKIGKIDVEPYDCLKDRDSVQVLSRLPIIVGEMK